MSPVMNTAFWWAFIAVVLIGLEILTGTFYLLMIALGAMVGFLFAIPGLSLNWQLGAAALAAIAATAGWHFYRYKNPKSAVYSENKDALIDIGETVNVIHWDPQQATQVRYRGANWSARWAGQGEPCTGACIIKGMKGNQLLLEAPTA